MLVLICEGMSTLSENSSASNPVGSTSTPAINTPTGPALNTPASSAHVPTSIETDSLESTPINDEAEANTSKLTSEVWNHFKKEKINGECKAVCNYCKKKYSGESRNGTSHLREYLVRCNKRVNRDIRQTILKANQIERRAGGKLRVTSLDFNQTLARKELAMMIIKHEYPLLMVDHAHFRTYSTCLQPLFEIPSRNTIKSDIMKIFKEEKAKTLSVLEANEGRIAITTDMWTADHQKKGYMAVTAHYIDNSWKLQKRIIRFEYVPTPHTKDVIASALMKCFLDWNIDRKLSSITLDNCSVNDGVVGLLIDRLESDALLLDGHSFHMRCCAHILHLIVRDGLDVIGDGIDRIRNSVLFWGATPKRWEKFEEAARQLRIPTCKKLSVDVKTRWNSTFFMLQTALNYKDVFPRCVQLHRDSLYKCLPTENDWAIASDICEKLKLFYDITDSFSGTKYTTANLYFPNICKIRLALKEWIVYGNATIKMMATRMFEKFEKYWDVVHGIMGVATILDPRYKTSLLEYYFESIYGIDAENEIERIVQICRDLLEEYQKKNVTTDEIGFGNFGALGSGGINNLSFSVSVGPIGGMADYDDYVSRRKKKKAKVMSELDRYLEEDVIPRKPEFDILNWWKTTGPQFPTLQCIVRDIYAIPVSTVASESTFSTGGRLVSAHRSRLHPTTIEALACSQNWLWADSAEEESLSREQTFCNEDDEEENENEIGGK